MGPSERVAARDLDPRIDRLAIADLLAALLTSREGLSSAAATARLERLGANEAIATPPFPALRQVLATSANPLVLILLSASAASALIGDVANAAIIATMVLLSAALGIVQTYRSHRAADQLRSLVAPTATVRRDGVWRDVPQREVVPGDVIRLAAGDLVPADARLVEERELHVDQAALTGESLPVEKEVVEPPPVGIAALEREDLVFLGTSVLSGAATAVVVRTGRKDRVRERLCAAGRAPARVRVRARCPPVRRADHAHRLLPRSLRRPCERCGARPARRPDACFRARLTG